MPVFNNYITKLTTITSCIKYLLIFFIVSAFANAVYGQAEVAPWGNITGIRVGGQLIGFESSLRIVENNGTTIKATAMERQKPKYMREGNRQIITTKIDSVNFTEVVEDMKPGIVKVDVTASSNVTINKDHVFFAVALPVEFYSHAYGTLNSLSPRRYLDLELTKGLAKDLTFTADSIRLISKSHNVQFVFDGPTEIIFKKNTYGEKKIIQVYI